jgi:cyclin-dependent kinase regulatory subunit CKS1
MPAEDITYSTKYKDDIYEYRFCHCPRRSFRFSVLSAALPRHVTLPPDIAKLVPKGRLLTEAEWRALGVQQSPGWVHYEIHKPEPHILLFRRPRTD